MSPIEYPGKGSQYDIDEFVLEPGEVLEDDYLLERIINRNRMALDLVGEWCWLFKIKQTGEKCPCTDDFYKQTNADNCKDCYGTTWRGGYDLIEYTHADMAANPYIKDGRSFLTRIIRSPNALNQHVALGYQPEHFPNGFCLAPPHAPQLSTRDIIIPTFIADRSATELVANHPVVRGEDVIPGDVIYNIEYIKSDKNEDTMYNHGLYRVINGNVIEWLDNPQPPAGSTYYVTYNKIVQYVHVYQVSKVVSSAMRGINTVQRFDLVELPKGHKATQLIGQVLGG